MIEWKKKKKKRFQFFNAIFILSYPFTRIQQNTKSKTLEWFIEFLNFTTNCPSPLNSSVGITYDYYELNSILFLEEFTQGKFFFF